MAAKPLPDQATLLKLLRYELETGKLYWRERTPDMFLPGQIAKESLCSRWNSRFAGKEAFTANSVGYRVGGVGGVNLRAHRVIWCMVYGYWPDHIDHIDQDRANNRLGNLREAGREGNARNCRLSGRNRSGRIGVYWKSREKKWMAKIRHGGRYIRLGMFKSFEDACAARSLAEKKYGYSPMHGVKKK